jgi:hypothetical protein
MLFIYTAPHTKSKGSSIGVPYHLSYTFYTRSAVYKNKELLIDISYYLSYIFYTCNAMYKKHVTFD